MSLELLQVSQAAIAIGGVATVWLSQDPRPRLARWACVVGVAVQPAWFHVTWASELWPIFGLSIVYLVGWLRGLWNFWLRPWWFRQRVRREIRRSWWPRKTGGPCAQARGCNLPVSCTRAKTCVARRQAAVEQDPRVAQAFARDAAEIERARGKAAR